MGREGFTHTAVIAVEPLHLLVGHHLAHDGCRVDGAECQRFEPQELAEGGLPEGRDEQGVFDAHTELPLEIDARLVGDGHAGMQRCRTILHAYLVRSLVHVEVAAHAVSRAVQIVVPLCPHILARQGVELCAAGTVGEGQHIELDVSFQHERIDASLLFGQRSECDSSRDVGRTVLILRATVYEQQPLRLQRHVGRLGGFVVHDGAVLLVGSNRVERDVAKQRLLAAQFIESPCDAHFRLPPLCDGRLQPFQELHHSDAVAEHRLMKTRYLGIVLYGFHRRHGRCSSHDAVTGSGFVECIVDAVGVEQDVIFEIVLQPFLHIPVVVHVDSRLFQAGKRLGGQLPVVNEECRFRRGDEQIGHEDGIAVHVAAPQIERPGDVVERRDEHSVSMLPAQRLPDAADFLACRLSRQVQRLHHHLVQRHGRTVGPHLRKDVEIGAQRESASLPQLTDQPFHHAVGTGHAVDAHFLRVAVAQLLAEPLRHGRRFGQTLLHQHKLRATQLLGGSDEIARIGPQRGTRHRHDCRTSRAVEARNPLATLPVVGHILAVVGVGTGENKCCQMLAAHHLAHGSQAVTNRFFHSLSVKFLFANITHNSEKSERR